MIGGRAAITAALGVERVPHEWQTPATVLL